MGGDKLTLKGRVVDPDMDSSFSSQGYFALDTRVSFYLAPLSLPSSLGSNMSLSTLLYTLPRDGV